MANPNYFDQVAEEYDSLYLDPISEAENQVVVDLIASSSSKATSVLDLGCGTGLMLERGPEYAPNLQQYTGLDISPSMIEQFRKKEFPGISYRTFVGDINGFTRFLESGEQFDVCLSTFGSFSYVDDLSKGLSNVKEYLKPGGAAVLMFYSYLANQKYRRNPQAMQNRFLGLYSFRNDDQHADDSHLAYFYSKKALEEALEVAGISEYSIQGLNHRDNSEYECLNQTEIEDILKTDMQTRPVDKAHSIVLIFGG